MRVKDYLNNNKKLVSNFSYLTILEVFILVAPLLTYPYLVRVLGRELYGWVITAQITASYCSILIDFGFKRISARNVALNINKPVELGKILSSILLIRGFLWVISFIIYFFVIFIIHSYHNHLTLFLYSFLTTLGSLLFIDFYFQGIENMRYITIINLIVRSIFIGLTFIIIKNPEDYAYVPLLWSIGYFLGGAISLWIVFKSHKIPFIVPSFGFIKTHLKESSIIFTSDTLITLKDKFNYNLMGAILGMSDIVIYDIGSKISNLLMKPIYIMNTVVYPRMSRNPSNSRAIKLIILTMSFSIIMVGIINIFLPAIVKFFIAEDVDLSAIRLYTTAPIILGISVVFSTNILFAYGKFYSVFQSSIVTALGYIILGCILYFSNSLKTVMSFVFLTLSAYFIEAVYRLILVRRILKKS